MRQVLWAADYQRMLRTCSADDLEPITAAVAGAAADMRMGHDLNRIVILCAAPLWRAGRLAGERLRYSGWDVSLALLFRDELHEPLADALICDMLFDPEADEPLAQKRRAWLEAVTGSGCPVLSVGIPAGVDPDTGRAEASAVRSEITLAPWAYLRGLFLHDGLDHCGEIRPVGGEGKAADGLCRFEGTDAKQLLPSRKRTAHKGDSGKALLCVGSPQYIGAALLSARGCLAAGCGILYVACPDVVRTALCHLPEAIGIPVGPDWNGESCQTAIRAMAGMRALGLGCGVGGGDVSPLIASALRTGLPLVLDADGLNCLSRHPELFPLLHDRVVLTPHPGEMSRLTGLTIEQVSDDPVELAARYARQWGCTVLLKGAATAVSDGKRTCLVAEGNAGLGKGGSGDVLTGIIAGLLSQGIEPFAAACLGSYLLGTSAEKAFALLRERMLRATDVIEALEDRNE